jgi:UDP-N-acetylmuramyl pentapeptide phosphotransferase/UDP-N-acetylglucosamine-1-phosphate transferase
VHAVPLILASLVAVGMAPAGLRELSERGLVRDNYRGRALPCPAGLVVVAAAAAALVPLAGLAQLAGAHWLRPELPTVALYAFGVAFLGLADDALVGGARGWRGHGAALLRGRLSPGALKAVGSLGLALLALAGPGRSDADYLLGAAVLVLATNLFNLLDLRPGRSIKALGLLGFGLTLGAWDVAPLWAVGLFAGPVLVLGLYDLRERAMLGDTGSNLVGALAGLWLVLSLSTLGLAIALAIMAPLTLYGEFRSISALVERVPLLRRLDSLGRPLHA